MPTGQRKDLLFGFLTPVQGSADSQTKKQKEKYMVFEMFGIAVAVVLCGTLVYMRTQ